MSIVNDKSFKLLVESYHFKPFYYFEKAIGKRNLAQYYFSFVSQAPNLRSLFKRVPKRERQLNGIGSWMESEWDTKNIGYRTARINFLMVREASFATMISGLQELYGSLEDELRENGLEYVFFRVNTSDLPLIHVLQANGFYIVDGILIQSLFIHDYQCQKENSVGISVRNAEKSDMDRVKHIAYRSFVFDRFHSDPFIKNETASQLHVNWIEDSFSVNPDDRVLVAEQNGTIHGFLSYSVNEHIRQQLGISIISIILLATHPESRRKGVARNLTQAVIKMARRESFEIVQVGTQLHNRRAISLYQGHGFRVVDSNYTFRKLF